MVVIVFLYVAALVLLGILSYGFTDPNLVLSRGPWFVAPHDWLFHLAYGERTTMTIVFASLLIILFACYLKFLKDSQLIFRSWSKLLKLILVSAAVLTLAYPALTYDLFNYMTTAKVLYKYGENPYLVMPIEIPNEPNLAFTRAANKVALYGPTWLLISALPFFAGAGNVWLTFLAFKAMNAVIYIGFCWLVYKWTKSISNVLFFALNPLVLVEVIMNGHNDIYMMVLVLLALRYKNWAAMVASWFVKEATLVTAPLMVLRMSWEKMLVAAYWLLAFVFFVFAPLREELYPWYAVWLIMPAALLQYKQHTFIWQFTIVLSFALELRALPYMWMGYYEGPGSLLRTILTFCPLTIFLVWYVWKQRKLQLS